MTEAPSGTSVTPDTPGGISGPPRPPGTTGAPPVPAWHGWPVGVRVVVRRTLPEGGFGDVLGDVLEVGEAGVLVSTRRGPVRVDAGEIVLAKRVPPPPARRPTGTPRSSQG